MEIEDIFGVRALSPQPLVRVIDDDGGDSGGGYWDAEGFFQLSTMVNVITAGSD